MGKVKSAFEKAMEKAAGIGELTPEEKERIKDQEKVKSILAEFYKSQIDRDGLWQKNPGFCSRRLRQLRGPGACAAERGVNRADLADGR